MLSYLFLSQHSNISIENLFNLFFETINIVSGKYLIMCIIILFYTSYTSLQDKIIYTSYTSDNYNDYLLSKILVCFSVSNFKFNIHILSNKILHPITIFLQSL